MSEEVMRQHIELYVNDYSIELGIEGKKAINRLFEIYSSITSSGKVHTSKSELFFS